MLVCSTSLPNVNSHSDPSAASLPLYQLLTWASELAFDEKSNDPSILIFVQNFMLSLAGNKPLAATVGQH